MKGGENQWEDKAAAVGVAAEPGSFFFFPRCSSEQTRQACPDDRSARDESSARLLGVPQRRSGLFSSRTRSDALQK